MANETNITWTDATWNIARGCNKVDDDCKYCYMYRESLNRSRYIPELVIKTKTVFNMPLKYKKTKSECWDGPPLIFTCSLTDFFHEGCDPFREEAWNIIRKSPHLIFQILTKRPERIKDCLPPDWGSGWDNVWLGTSVGSQKSIERAWRLLDSPSKCYFLSLEPLHEAIDLNEAELLYENWRNRYSIGRYIDWVIVGGESGNENGLYRYRPCKIEWIEFIVNQCKKENVPVYVKQLGTHIAAHTFLKSRHGSDINEFPEHLKIREFPKL